MAGFIALSAALSRLTTIACPFCGKKKQVERKPCEYRVCPRCKRRFPDPLARPKPKKRR